MTCDRIAERHHCFELRTGETLSGQVRWWDLGAFGLDTQDGRPLTVVQRHAVLDWDRR